MSDIIDYGGGPWQVGQDLIVTINLAGEILVENEIPPGKSEEIAAPSSYRLGAVPDPGQYMLHIRAAVGDYFGFLLFLPNDSGSLDLIHPELLSNVPAPMEYSGDSLSKLLAAVFEPGQPAPDRLDRAFQQAYAEHSGEAALLVGSTVMICAVAGATATVLGPVVGKFCLSSIAGTAIEFVRILTDALIDIVFEDGRITDDERTFLKILVGTQGALTSLSEGVLAPEKIAATVHFVEAMAGSAQVASTSKVIKFGAATSAGFVNRVHIFYEISGLPLP